MQATYSAGIQAINDSLAAWRRPGIPASRAVRPRARAPRSTATQPGVGTGRPSVLSLEGLRNVAAPLPTPIDGRTATQSRRVVWVSDQPGSNDQPNTSDSEQQLAQAALGNLILSEAQGQTAPVAPPAPAATLEPTRIISTSRAGWKVPQPERFAGDGKVNLNSWLSGIELHGDIAQIPRSEWADVVASLLKGDAMRDYQNTCSQTCHIRDWDNFCDVLRCTYGELFEDTLLATSLKS